MSTTVAPALEAEGATVAPHEPTPGAPSPARTIAGIPIEEGSQLDLELQAREPETREGVDEFPDLSPEERADIEAEVLAEGKTGPAKPDRFRFAGEEWDTQDKAEQSFKTLRGKFKAMEERTGKAEQAAYGWQLAHDRLERRVRELEAVPAQQVPAKGEPADDVDKILSGIDWDFYTSLAQQDPERGQAAAAYWLNKKLTTGISALIDARVKAATERLGDFQGNVEQNMASANLFRQAKDYVDQNTGKPVFPELSDPAQAEGVVTLWQNLGLDPKTQMSLRGIWLATVAYRDLFKVAGAQSSTPQPIEPAAAAALESLERQAAGASVVSPGSTTFRADTRPEDPRRNVARLIAQAGGETRLGVRR